MKQETLEEAKQRAANYMSLKGALEPKALTKLEIAKNIASIGIGKKEEPKQETLEEASKDYIENTMKFSFNSLETKTQANRMLKCAEFGAKWQQERMYSEEEVESLLHKYMQSQIPDWHGWSTTKWFEQFKKKQDE